jgi:ribosome-associated protein
VARKSTSRPLAIEIARACYEKKAEDVIVLDLRKLTFVTDFFVIGTTQTHRQARAVNDELRRTLKPRGIRALGTEGMDGSPWVLIDYGEVVCHLFEAQARTFYDLEALWADAPRTRWKPAKRPAPAKKAN